MWRWLVKSVWGSNRSPQFIVAGSLYRYDPNNTGQPVRCLFMRCEAVVDQNESENFDRYLVIRPKDEMDSGDGERSMPRFLLEPSLQFCRILEGNDGRAGKMTQNQGKIVGFAWESNEYGIWNVFALSQTTNATEADFFRMSVCQNIWEYRHGTPFTPEHEKSAELEHFCGIFDFPFDLETLNPKPSQRQSLAPQAAAANRTPPAAAANRTPPPANRTPPPANRTPPPANRTPQAPAPAPAPSPQRQAATPSPTTRSVSKNTPPPPRSPQQFDDDFPDLNQPPKQKSPARKVIAAPAEAETFLKNSLYPTNISADELQDELDADNLLTDEAAIGDMFYFSSQTSAFEPMRTDVTLSIYRIGEIKNFQFMLVIEDPQDQSRLVAQLIRNEMNLLFSEMHHSIIWTMNHPEIVTTWSFVFRNADEEVSAKKTLWTCLWETSNQQQAKAISEEDRAWLASGMEVESAAATSAPDEYQEDDFMDFVSDDEGSEDEESEEEEEEYDVRRQNRTSTARSVKNSLLADSYRYHKAFVAKGSQIGVFQHADDAVYQTSLNVTIGKDKSQFTPSRMVLHDQDSSLLLLHPNQEDDRFRGAIYRMDLNRGEIVDEWRPKDTIVPVREFVPMTKYGQQRGEKTFAILNANSIVGMDPRTKGKDMVIGDIAELTSRSKPDFSCGSTSDVGQLAVGNRKGEIRLYSGIPGVVKLQGKGANPKSAKTLLPGFGDPIRGIDVSADGFWVLATCSSYLLVIPTVLPDDEEKTGFNVRMGAKKPPPRRLQLRPEDVANVCAGDKPLDFTPARFNTGCDGEVWVVTSTNEFLITWNFRRVKQGKFFDYTIKKLHGKIVAGQFASVSASTPGRDAPIVVTLEDDVRMEQRVSTGGKVPYKSSHLQYQ